MEKKTKEEMVTPINKAIKEFGRLREKATTLRDSVYLAGVLAVLDTFKSYEEEYGSQCRKEGFEEGYKKANEDIFKVL